MIFRKLQITSQRPVFNSDYKSLLMSYIDKNVTFKYIRNSPIQYFEGQHVDNLADILAYYIYMILGTITILFLWKEELLILLKLIKF